MALTWPYADPHFAAYMFAAAATAAYGQNYWTRGSTPGSTAPTSQGYPASVAPYVMRAMGASVAGLSAPSTSPPVLSSPIFSPTARSSDGMTNLGNSGCCESLFCRGCPSSMLSASPRIQAPSPTTSSASSPLATTPTTFSPSLSSKPLFQPYKNDVRK